MVIVGFGTIITVVGGALFIAAAALFFYAMLYTVKMQREPTIQVYCPYCAVKNDVFRSRKEFACDICGRRIGFGASGEPIALDPVEDDD
jgi:ribosomal protein S27E